MEKNKKQKIFEKKVKRVNPETSKSALHDEDVYREINCFSFGDNLTLLIQHYKRQSEIDLSKNKVL